MKDWLAIVKDKSNIHDVRIFGKSSSLRSYYNRHLCSIVVIGNDLRNTRFYILKLRRMSKVLRKWILTSMVSNVIYG